MVSARDRRRARRVVDGGRHAQGDAVVVGRTAALQPRAFVVRRALAASGRLTEKRRRMRFVVLLCAAASIAGAQSASGPDAVYARAKQLVVSGNGAAGRVLIDSVLAANTSDSPVFADALYW